MKHRSYLVNGLIIGIVAFLFGVIGYAVGHWFISDYNTPWTHHFIQSPPNETEKIVHVDIQSSLEDPTGDIVFVETINGDVYSIVLFQKKWERVDTVPTWDNTGIYPCAPDWPGPTDAHIWDPPPVEFEVVDSAGVRFERPLSIIARCYVLLNDGNLTVWVHSDDFSHLSAFLILRAIMILFGIVVGVILGIIIVINRNTFKNTNNAQLHI